MLSRTHHSSRLPVLAAVSIAVFAPLAGCRSATPTASPRLGVAVAALESARVIAPLVHRSCAGAGFCREDVASADDSAAIDELDDDCARRGGTSSGRRCKRDGAVASCRVGAEGALGAIAVFAYGVEARDVVAERCEAFDGTFAELGAASSSSSSVAAALAAP